jgi:hypothetical protein
MSRQFTISDNGIIADGIHDYTVVISDNGTFSALYEPNNNNNLTTPHPITANGSLKGTQTIDVTATSRPNTSALPAQIPGDVTTTYMINQLFPNGTIGSWDYAYSYHAGTQTYTQTTTSISGDITGK